MKQEKRKGQRGRLGYGSSYRKGDRKDMDGEKAIGSVLGGQVWLVKPDRKAQANFPCLWMTSGVVKYKNCINFFDCTNCSFDRGMHSRVEKGKQISWQQAMRRMPDIERDCRHSLTGRIAGRTCGYDYHCEKCDFDQYFEDVWTQRVSASPTEVQNIKGFEVAVDHYFHDGHTWARIESGGTIRIGMDDFALKLLGKADGYDLPLIGKELDAGRPGWGLKRKSRAADVQSPVDGVIVEVNSNIRENPDLTNRSPYGDGWLFTVHHPNIKSTVKSLMSNTDTLSWLGSEVLKLEEMIEETAGPLAADGGYLQEDIYGNLPDLGWNNLTKTFLKT
jgi:glycine cleavage system H lipoate-binding protein